MEKEIEVVDVEFLTSAKITMKEGEDIVTKEVMMDLANRKVYPENSNMENAIFRFLDKIETLPEGFFFDADDLEKDVMEAYKNEEESYSHLFDAQEESKEQSQNIDSEEEDEEGEGEE